MPCSKVALQKPTTAQTYKRVITVAMFFRTDRNIGTPVRKARGALLVAAGLIGVLPLMAACSGNGGKGPEAQAAADTTPALVCPKVSIPDETREVTQFRSGGARDMTDVVSRAAVLQYDGGCEFDDAGVTVNLNLLLGAERGPAARDAQGAYQYFVAITNPAGQIIGKQQFDTTIAFSPNVGKGTSAEELVQKIPLAKGATAAGYGILVGFQLTPEQLAFNRDPRKSF
jgi:hypothetical protein